MSIEKLFDMWRNYEILKYYVICAAVSALSWLSQFCTSKNRFRENSKIRHFVISSLHFYWHAKDIKVLTLNQTTTYFEILIENVNLADARSILPCGNIWEDWYLNVLSCGKKPPSETAHCTMLQNIREGMTEWKIQNWLFWPNCNLRNLKQPELFIRLRFQRF